MLTLSLWQISVIAAMAVIAALIGTLVGFARTLANKVGKAYAALRRIEELLIAANAPKGRVSTLGASMEAVGSAQCPIGSDIGGRERRNHDMPVREMAHREVSVPELLLAEGAMHEMGAGGMSAADNSVPERDRRVSYLTVRDLKVMTRSGRRRSDTAISQEAAAQLSARLFSTVQSDAASGDVHQHSGQASAIQADSGPSDAGPEPVASSSSRAVLQELVAATSEVRALLNEGAESADPPMVAVAAPDVLVTEAHEEMYAYPELRIAPEQRAAPDSALEAVPEAASNPAPEASAEAAPQAAAETAPEAELTLAPRVESHPAPVEASIEIRAPIATTPNPTASVEDQPAPPISGDSDAELAEKRRKRTAELILAAHHRRRRARGH